MLFPLLLWQIVARAIPTRSYLAAFFAGFCLIANGAYLAGDTVLQGGMDGSSFCLASLPGPSSRPAYSLSWQGFTSGRGLGRISASASRRIVRAAPMPWP